MSYWLLTICYGNPSQKLIEYQKAQRFDERRYLPSYQLFFAKSSFELNCFGGFSIPAKLQVNSMLPSLIHIHSFMLLLYNINLLLVLYNKVRFAFWGFIFAFPFSVGLGKVNCALFTGLPFTEEINRICVLTFTPDSPSYSFMAHLTEFYTNRALYLRILKFKRVAGVKFGGLFSLRSSF